MNNFTALRQAGVSIGLFLLALSPRIVNLEHFVTADEAKWVHRSAQFSVAVLRGDWEKTFIEPVKPAVTTMWTGGVGLWAYHRLNEQGPLIKFLKNIPEWRVDPQLLRFMRMPTVLLTSAGIVLIYHLARPLMGVSLALLATGLLSLDPYFVGQSRFLHHDALVTTAAIPSLLLAIRASRQTRPQKALVASGVFAGLALLTKSTSLVLLPFVGLLLLVATRQRGLTWLTALREFTVWGLSAAVIFVVLWPAAWLQPVDSVVSMVQNTFQESTEASGIVVLPDLGPFYYLTLFAFHVTPVALIGLVMWLWLHKKLPPLTRYTTQAIAIFGAFFLVLFMVFSAKRGARYILPSYVSATLVASSGWYAWLAHKRQRTKLLILIALFSAQFLSVAPYAPYYISYLNPLLGGQLTAPNLIRIGWGEGMDKVGEWLNQNPDAKNLVVSTSYLSTIRPYFDGELVTLNSRRADYTVIYIKELYSFDIPAFEYYEAITPVAVLKLAGVEYAKIFTGAPLKMLEDHDSLVAYRMYPGSLAANQEAWIDLIWRFAGEAPDIQPLFMLRRDTQTAQPTHMKLVSRQALVSGGTITSYALTIPYDDLEPGEYTLNLGERPLDIYVVK